MFVLVNPEVKSMNKTKNNFVRLSLVAGLTLYAIPALAAMIHRYSFNESPGSTNVTDSVGTANGYIMQIDADANGVPDGNPVTFDGSQATLDGTGGYIDLPSGLVSGLTNVTFEMWTSWGGPAGDFWQRFFDFGAITNVGGAGGLKDTNGTMRGSAYQGHKYMFLTPCAGGSTNMRFAVTDAGNPEERPVLNDILPFPTFAEVHVAVTYGSDCSGGRLFYNGVEFDSKYVDPASFIPLSAVLDTNCWLGRSVWGADPMFAGYFNEFRMHGDLLTQQQLMASANGGPDNTNTYDPGTVTSFNMTVAGSMIVGQVQVPQLSASFSGVGTIPVLNPLDLTSLTSSATNVISINAARRLVAVGPGNATITAVLDTTTNTANINVSASVPVLAYRWSFNEPAGSTTVTDSVSSANGTVIPSVTTNITLGSGQAVFPGGAYNVAPYIDLPDGIITNRTNITVEIWFTWGGPNTEWWQRIFDFGSSTKAGGIATNNGSGIDYIFLSPRGGSGIRFAAKSNSIPENPVLTGPLPAVNTEHHVAVVYAPEGRFSRIYLNGITVATGDAVTPLNAINATNNWIGTAQWPDPGFRGSLNEFRIWEGTLGDLNVALSRKAGPNSLPADPGDLVSVSVQATNLLIGNPATSPSYLLGNFQNVTSVDITGLSGVSLVSQDTNIFTVSTATVTMGALTPRNVGSAGLRGSYLGIASTSTVYVLAPVALKLDLTNSTLYAGGAPITAALLADFPGSSTNGFTNVNVSAFNGVTRSSSDTNVATITAAGVVTPLNPGTTTLTSTYGGLTNQFVLSVVLPPGFQLGSLVHRYGFDGTGTTIVDSIGAIDGVLTNTVLDGSGTVSLANSNVASSAATLQWVSFPQSLIPAGASSITLETWFTPGAYLANNATRGNWIFNLNDGVAGAQWTGQYLFYTPWNAGAVPDRQSSRWSKGGWGAGMEVGYVHTSGLNSGQHHVAVVVDGVNMTLSLYTDGALLARSTYDSTWNLAALTNCWLAKSSYDGDIGYWGSITEFRVYQGVLLPSDIAASIAAGPGTYFVARPALSISLAGSNVQIKWTTNAAPGLKLEGTPVLGAGASWSTNGIPAPTVVGGQSQVTIAITETNTYYRLKN